MTETKASGTIYEFTHVELNQEDFLNLVFMNAPPDWNDPFLKRLCKTPLRCVVEEVIKEFRSQNSDYANRFRIHDPKSAVDIFSNLNAFAKNGDTKSWFDKHRKISANFDIEKMRPLWIRNVSYWKDNHDKPQGEKAKNPSCNYYIEDGCTRALVYALRIERGESGYEPVRAIQATS